MSRYWPIIWQTPGPNYFTNYNNSSGQKVRHVYLNSPGFRHQFDLFCAQRGSEEMEGMQAGRRQFKKPFISSSSTFLKCCLTQTHTLQFSSVLTILYVSCLFLLCVAISHFISTQPLLERQSTQKKVEILYLQSCAKK